MLVRQAEGAAALTTSRAWGGMEPGIAVEVIR